jgi:preprotein translocase subunit SecB
MKIIEVRILKIDFNFNNDFKGQTGTISYNPDIALRHKFVKEKNELVVFVGLRQKSGDVPYYFEVEGAGLFKFDETPDPSILETFSTINCPAIVFPYIREAIADITRRAGFQALHINPVNFVELAKKSKEEAQKEKPTS